jgi:transposase
MKSVLYVGLDVHKDSIVVALVDENGEDRHYGTIKHTMNALDKLCRRLLSKGPTELKFVYEAGPCGYGIFRHLSGLGFECTVVAPSKIPKQSGNRIKNDRRDALNLCRLHRAGELTPVHVPTPEDEAMRDLVRARDDAKIAEKTAKQKLSAFLLRHGIRYSGRSTWSSAHMKWLADLKMEHSGQQIVLQEYIGSLQEATQRVARLTEQMRLLIPEWNKAPLVEALQALRGVRLISAAIIVTEIGDFRRFANPKELMSYLGLVPSEYASGDHIKRGGITKTGNKYARRALVESAWSYRMPARVSRTLLKRQEGLPQVVKDISWKAQLRLCARYRKFQARGKRKQVTVTAIAKELAGFVWSIAQEVTPANA